MTPTNEFISQKEAEKRKAEREAVLAQTRKMDRLTLVLVFVVSTIILVLLEVSVVVIGIILGIVAIVAVVCGWIENAAKAKR